MKSGKLWTVMGLVLMVGLFAPSVMAQCRSVAPTQINLFESECISVCPFTQYAFFLWCPYPGEVNFPHLILTPGCNQGGSGCDTVCNPIDPPRWPWMPGEQPTFGQDPHQPDAIFIRNDCMEIYVYWSHAGYWVFELWTYNCSGCFCLHFDWQLPVELNAFEAVGGDNQVNLTWSTQSESSNDRFEVIRSDRGRVAQISSLGNGASGHDYSWTDTDVTNGQMYTYVLRSVDMNNTTEELSTASATPTVSVVATVEDYALYQNYPNPFNPSTQIMFDVPEASDVKLVVYNPVGQQVATLVNSRMNAGRHTTAFDGSRLTSGLYFYTITANNFTATRKMLLVK